MPPRIFRKRPSCPPQPRAANKRRPTRPTPATWQSRSMAWYAPAPLPLTLFGHDEAVAIWKSCLARLEEEILDIRSGAADWGEAVRLPARYSMADWDAETATIEVHRVVQEILRNRMRP